MSKHFLSAMAVLSLLGCGVPEYFDQHPPNVRAASAIDPDDETPAQVKTAVAPVETVPLPAPDGHLPAPAHDLAGQQTERPNAVARPESPPGQVDSAAQVASQSPIITPTTSPIETTSAVPASVPAAAAPMPVESQPVAESGPIVSLPPPAVTLVPTRAAQTASAPAEDVASIPSSPPSPPPPTPVQAIVSPPVVETASAPVPAMQTAAMPPSYAMPAVPAHDAHCEAVATARAEDAAANGKGDDLQKVVHDGTYADCVAWANAHPGGN